MQGHLKHIFEDAACVLRMLDALTSDDSDQVVTMMLGGMMRRVHASCQKDYKGSCADVDALVNCAPLDVS